MTTNNHAHRRPYPLFIAHLRGTQREMGAQHGSMTRAAGGWQAVMDYYPRMPEILVAGDSAVGRMAVRPLVELGAAALEQARPRELRQRSRAYMEGLGMSAGLSRHYQCMDVFQNMVNLAGRYRLGPFAQRLMEQAPPACSTLVTWGAASDDGTLRHARNFDFPGVGIWERLPAIVYCTPDQGLRYGFVTVRGGDIPTVSAFNEAGLVLTTHTRFHRDAHWRGMGIVDLGHEIIRSARTLAEAEAIIRRRPVASSWGFCVSSASERRSVCFEVCGGHVHVVEPGAEEEYLAATNHYIHPEMQKGQVVISPAFMRNTIGRYQALRSLASRGGLSVADLQGGLGSYMDVANGVERAAGGVVAQVLSVHSVVIEPERERLCLSLGPVPTGCGPWVTIDWDWRDEPGFAIKRFDEQLEALPTHHSPRYGHGDAAEAMASFVEAAAISGRAGDPARAQEALDRAVALDPTEATYRLMAGGARLRANDPHGALEHFYKGLEHEAGPFYRGQFLLWAMRAANAAADEVVAGNLRRELMALEHPLLAEHKHQAQREVQSPLSASALTRVRLNYHLGDLAL